MDKPNMGKFNINKDLLPMKAQYFLFNAGLAGIFPFLPIYARQLGFSSVAVGIIYTVLPITGTIGKPLFGLTADIFQMQKLLLIVLHTVTAFSLFMVQFIPAIPSEVHVTLNCSSSTHILISDNSCNVSDLLNEIDYNGTTTCQILCIVPHNTSLLQDVWTEWNLTQHVANQSNTKIRDLRISGEISFSYGTQNETHVGFPVHHVWLEGEEVVPVCKNEVAIKCKMMCTDTLHKLLSCDTNVLQLYEFWLFFLLLVIANISKAVIASMGDAVCFQLLGDQASEYGKQRLWGAIGFGTFSIFCGVLVDKFSTHQIEKDYTGMFYLTLLLFLAGAVVSYFLKCNQLIVNENVIHNVGKLFLQIPVVIFMLWCTFVGIVTGLLWQFLFWHLEDLIPSNDTDTQDWIKTIEGLVGGVRCFGGELPVFFIAGCILKKIGHVHAMSLVLFTFGIRFILYSILANPWWCLPLELFQGITFGIFYTAMASYASAVAPAGAEATVQGFMGALFDGVGVSLGSFIGGITYDKYGGAATFRGFGIAAFVAFFLHVIAQQFLVPPLKKQPENDGKGEYALPIDAVSAVQS